jgi:hypothetical protein
LQFTSFFIHSNARFIFLVGAIDVIIVSILDSILKFSGKKTVYLILHLVEMNLAKFCRSDRIRIHNTEHKDALSALSIDPFLKVGEVGGRQPVFRIRIQIRIHQIHMFFGLPEPGPLVKYMDPDPAPDPFIIKQNSEKNLDFYCFVTTFGLFIFEK